MIRLYDTTARDKREFQPADPQRITMYVCGPTVYGRAHIGNARPAVVFDTLARLLRHRYGEESLVYARNITDVDDKIIDAAAAEGVEPEVITARFEQHYLEDMRALGVRDPDLAPHATAEIEPMVAMIGELVAKGHAYAAEGHVLFDVSSDPDYGVLSRRDREAMLAGARVEVAPYKRSPGDFVLWKPSAEGVIGWESPWGRGRPGWHIECSAMIRAHLGETIDIHGGGLDLVFPHHENEAAQSRCTHGTPLARFWLHNGFVDFGAEKMSKSLGNVVTPGELLAAGHKGEVLRLALLSAHYRSPLPWTESLLTSAKQRYDRLLFVLSWFSYEDVAPDPSVVQALEDDLNTPKALSEISKLASRCLQDISASVEGLSRSEEEEDEVFLRRGVLLSSVRLLGLDFNGVSPPFSIQTIDTDNELGKKLHLRDKARKAGAFEEADRLRREVEALGFIVMDFKHDTYVMSDEAELDRS